MTRPSIEPFLVTAAQMRQIESRTFAAGMPVAALMEKVGQLIAARIQTAYPDGQIGILAGPGHNGGDALVVARALFLQGRQVQIYVPLTGLKPLTDQHRQYATHLGVPTVEQVEPLKYCAVIVDGLFGFGLTRPIEGSLAADIDWLNRSEVPVVSIDLPSGIHTDTGAVMGTAVRSHRTLCLGLWKQAFVQAAALPYLGESELIDFGLPLADIQAELGQPPTIQRLTPAAGLAALPLDRDPTAHKYKVGHLLLMAGSRTYAGAAILAAQGAKASGVGMVTLAVPESLRLMLVTQSPEALVIGCPEQDGAISGLPDTLTLDKYDAIALGPGLTTQAAILSLLAAPIPLVIDADGLNILAAHAPVERLRQRSAPTLLTPHPGEFQRLFPDLGEALAVAQTAAELTGATIILKRARSAIATPEGMLWINPDSTPALARGGSGDVLTGLAGGLLAQLLTSQQLTAQASTAQAAIGAVWWHAQAALYAHQRSTVLGVDPLTLAAALSPALRSLR
ncbi:MAG: NAD(P)H-hydrate dehydratase [Cyanobacteria bacterium J06554_6]